MFFLILTILTTFLYNQIWYSRIRLHLHATYLQVSTCGN